MSFVKRRVVRRELLKGQWMHGRMDAISPYTYLQDTRYGGIAQRGASVCTPRWRQMEGWSRCNWSRRLDGVYSQLQREPPHGTTIMTKNSEAEKGGLSVGPGRPHTDGWPCNRRPMPSGALPRHLPLPEARPVRHLAGLQLPFQT